MADYSYKTWGSTPGVFTEGDTVEVFEHKVWHIKVLRVPDKIKIQKIWTPISELNLDNRDIEELTVPATVQRISTIYSSGLRRLIILGDGCKIHDNYSKGTFTQCKVLSEVYMPVRCLAYLKEFKGAPWYDKFVADFKGELIIDGTLIKVKDAVDYVVPAGVKSILENAFDLSPDLRSVTLPESIEELDSTFKGCTKLEKVTFPKQIKPGTKLDSTFIGCTALQELQIPDGVETLDTTCKGCTSLKRVILPADSVKKIWFAFEDCTALTEFKIPDGVEILRRAFKT